MFTGPVTTPVKPWLKKIAEQMNRSLSTKGLVFLVNHGITEERVSIITCTEKSCILRYTNTVHTFYLKSIVNLHLLESTFQYSLGGI